VSDRHYTQSDRWYEYVVNVTRKINEGSLGIKYERQGEFIFCAQSADDARAIAGYHVKDGFSSVDTTRMVQIVGKVPVSREVFLRESPSLKSCFEYASELEAEMEVVS